MWSQLEKLRFDFSATGTYYMTEANAAAAWRIDDVMNVKQHARTAVALTEIKEETYSDEGHWLTGCTEARSAVPRTPQTRRRTSAHTSCSLLAVAAAAPVMYCLLFGHLLEVSVTCWSASDAMYIHYMALHSADKRWAESADAWTTQADRTRCRQPMLSV